MQKLDQQTLNFTDEHIANIATMFPHCVTEVEDESGTLKQAIDFDLLKQELSANIVDGPKERYRIDWPGKRASLLSANTPINKTLRPDVEDSVNFDTTQNLYIEGDNLEALKLLQESYLGEIKMIYIDPPYNTGKDFVYKDNFTRSKEEELEASGQVDAEGGRLVANLESNGRFHSDWLSMMYPRLRLARNLLKDDGVIFISIGQDEVASLVQICNEIYGEINKISIVGRLAKSGGNKGKYFSPNIEYLLVYAKNIEQAKGFRDEMDENLIKKVYTKTQKGGSRDSEKYRAMGLYQSSLDPMRGCINQRYYVEAPDGTLVIPNGSVFPDIKKEGEKIKPKSGEDGVWRWTYPKYLEEFNKGNVEFKKTSNKVLVNSEGNYSEWNVNTKIWLKDRQEEGQLPNDFISKYENRHSAKELKELNIPFDFPKPSNLIKFLIKISGVEENDLVLDFFSGSATTAHAVMQLNAEDNKKRKFIMIQLAEATDEKSEAYKAGYETIAEIGKERIRRAGEKIKEKNADQDGIDDLDIGFRVLKIDESNMKDIYFTPDQVDKASLFDTINHIKEDRTAEDLLFGVLVDWGVDLTLPIQREEILGKTVFFVGEDALTACFDEGLDEAFITELAGRDTMRVVFKESGFENDETKINAEQIFAQLSPGTDLRVI